MVRRMADVFKVFVCILKSQMSSLMFCKRATLEDTLSKFI